MLLWILLSLFSCHGGSQNTDNNQGANVRVDPNSLQPGPVLHESLTARQTEQIDYLYQTFKEVDSTSREKWMDDFKRDQNPDTEIEVWMMMANAYNSYCQNKRLDLFVKKEVFQLLLMRSMMPESDVLKQLQSTYLTEKDAVEIMKGYKLEAKPVKVIKR